MLKDNESICSNCGRKCNDDTETKFDKDADPYCPECYDTIYAKCILCAEEFMIGEDGNELGFCLKCQEKPDFPYDLDAYYKDYDAGKVVFKGFETMSRGLLENYRR